jgi:transcriptional regulator with XRE-family HTH domain
MNKSKSNKRRPDSHDAEIGRRVRVRRLALGMSQTELGKHLGITFQQVQKYEGGVNRIGSGRLQRIAEVLEVPITYFFEGEHDKIAATGDVTSPLDYIKTEGALKLVRAFSQIANSNLRFAIVQIVENMAAASPAPKRKK